MIKEEMDQMRLKGQVSNRGGGGGALVVQD